MAVQFCLCGNSPLLGSGCRGIHQELKLCCGHLFHKDCLKQYAVNYVATALDHPINCPDSQCKQEIDAILLTNELLDTRLFVKYGERLMISAITRLITCPNLHCRLQFEGEHEDFQCPSCQWLICKSCKSHCRKATTERTASSSKSGENRALEAARRRRHRAVSRLQSSLSEPLLQSASLQAAVSGASSAQHC